jgi:hypothetical protein
MADQEESNGWMASAWSMGAAAWNYAADTVNRSVRSSLFSRQDSCA